MLRHDFLKLQVTDMKIHLLGPSGSGTSTLGQLIAETYHFPWFDTDAVFWEKTDPPFSTKRELNERTGRLKQIFEENDDLVLSGSALGWGDFIKDALDIVIYKYLPQDIRIKRLMTREKERYGARITYGHDMYAGHKSFIDWCYQYETGGMTMRSRRSELAWLKDINCTLLKLEDTLTLEAELAIVSEVIVRQLGGRDKLYTCNEDVK